MAISEDDPHTARVEDGCWQTVYWRGNVASGARDATRAELQVYWPGSGYSSAFDFELPKDARDLESMRRTFARIYSQGKAARSAEMLALLGGK